MALLIRRLALVLVIALLARQADAAGAGSGFIATSASSAENHAVAFFNGTIASASAGDTAAAQTLARLAIDAANQAIALGSPDGAALNVIIAAMDGYLQTGVVMVDEAGASFQFTPTGVLVWSDDGTCEFLTYDEFDDMISTVLDIDDGFDFSGLDLGSDGPSDGGGDDSSAGFQIHDGSSPWDDPLGEGKKHRPFDYDSQY